jgi:hypothetical protein
MAGRRLVQGGTIGSDVIRDELTEERPPGCLRAERRCIVFIRCAIAQPTGSTKSVQKRVVCREFGQIRKQASV